MAQQACPRCGVLNQPGAKFCRGCGCSLAQAQPPGPQPPGWPSGPGTQRWNPLAAHLIIQELGQLPRQVQLIQPVTSLGREPGNDIVIGEKVSRPVVSRQHARLELIGADYYITDLNSSNGTHVNSRHINPQTRQQLRHGDVIRIGDRFGNSVSMTFQIAGLPPGPPQAAVGRLDLQPHKVANIGRAPDNTFVLNHTTVSAHHVRVERLPTGQHRLYDLNSTNGTFVNLRRVTAPRLLQNGDIVQIGPYRLVYSPACLDQHSNTRLPLEAVKLRREVFLGLWARLRWASDGKGSTSGKLVLLNNVSLAINPGEFVALVGGSGAGKSTLLKALSGFSPAQGQVLVNGEDLYRNFAVYQMMIGYVPQEDVIHYGLTARQVLSYAARLRIPGGNQAEEEKRVREVLETVEMTDHADKMVKDLSGGQRKRINMAMELLADPALFFLDEPTSGLDPGLEKKMMSTLRKLADEGKTVVLVTHATANIKQCHYVAFMAHGQLAYFGPPGEAKKFFNDANDFSDIYSELSIRAPSPPAPKRSTLQRLVDWLNELAELIGLKPRQPTPKQSVLDRLDPKLRPYYYRLLANRPDDPPTTAAEVWAECFRESPDYRDYVQSRSQKAGGSSSASAPTPQANARSQVPWWKQLAVLVQRQLNLIRFDYQTMLILLFVMPLVALLLNAITDPTDLLGKMGVALDPARQINTIDTFNPAQRLLFMLALATTFLGVFASAFEIVKESAIYRRERMVSLQVIPYLLSKIGVLGMFALLQCFLLLFIVSRHVEFSAGKGALGLPVFLEFYVTLVLAALASIALGLLISTISSNSNMVVYLILFLIFAQIILAGAFFKPEGLIEPLSRMTVTRWTLEALGSTVDMEALNSKGKIAVEVEVEVPGSGVTEKKKQEMPPPFEPYVDYEHSARHLLSRWLALGAITLFVSGLSAFVLWRQDVI